MAVATLTSTPATKIAAPPQPTPANLFGADRDTLAAVCEALGEPAYRARQLYAWLYRRRVTAFDRMTNLKAPLRQGLAAAWVLRWPQVAERLASGDGTVKYLMRLEDGVRVESVLIPEPTRRTVCLSSQAGCPLRCAFCLTGVGGYRRNLTAGEILGQAAVVMQDASPAQLPWNMVLMGMGEPLLNFEATLAALRILMDPHGFAIPARRVTLSTVGIIPALERLMLEPVLPNLAISLHAARPALRRQLMPIESKYPMEAVLALARRYVVPRGGRITLEYVLLAGVNDSLADSRALARLVKGGGCKINLIPLNPAPEIPFTAPTPEVVDAFAQVLAAAQVPVSVRRARGQDVLAACGQLHLRQSTIDLDVP
jgi:23S rRNA (adenine2503-C2)-methyltransferase